MNISENISLLNGQPLVYYCNNKFNKNLQNSKYKILREEENAKDPKYKTELCKKFSQTGKCPYGNKCRFAHGKDDLILKIQSSNYKKKDCKTFTELGFCPYGARCSFRHEERNLKDIQLPYYYINLFILNKSKPLDHRLGCFEEISPITNDNSSSNNISNNNILSSNSNSYSNENDSLLINLNEEIIHSVLSCLNVDKEKCFNNFQNSN